MGISKLSDRELRTLHKQVIALVDERNIYYNYDEKKANRELKEVWQGVDGNCEKIKEHQKEPNY